MARQRQIDVLRPGIIIEIDAHQVLVCGLPGRVAISEGEDVVGDGFGRDGVDFRLGGRRLPAHLIKEGLIIEQNQALVCDGDAVKLALQDAGAVSPGHQFILPAVLVSQA